MQPRGQKPDLGMAHPKSGAQAEQTGDHEGLLEKTKDVLS